MSQNQDLLNDALDEAVTANLGSLGDTFRQLSTREGVGLRAGAEDATWSRGYVLAGGLLPSASSPQARLFNQAVVANIPRIQALFAQALHRRGLKLSGVRSFEWDPERNAFAVDITVDPANPNQEHSMSNQKQPPRDPNQPAPQTDADPAVKGAPDLKTEAEKAADKEAGGDATKKPVQ